MPVVTIQMAVGRTHEQKKKVIAEFTDTLVRNFNVPPEMITIFIQELPKEHIGKMGKPLSEKQ